MAGPKVNRGAVFQALTGRAGVDVSGRGDDIRGMLAAVGGESDRTRSGIDLTAAARKLGVHRSTVARWLSRAEGGPGSVPSGDHMKSLRKRARQAARANIAVTHAIESDPENSLTRLLALLVGQTQVPPSVWPSDALDEITEAAAVHALGDAPN